MLETDLVRRARQTDLVEWLRRNNEPLKRVGQWWFIAGADSLRIQGNKWFRNSQGCGGNAIDFLVHYYGLSPADAIKRLLQDAWNPMEAKKDRGVKEKKLKAIRSAAPNAFDLNAITPANDQRRLIAYLVKTRGLPVDIVLAEIQAGRLFQELRTNNAVFVMKNEVGASVGAEVAGTLGFDNARFKGVRYGSTGGYGYAFGQTSNPRFVLYFESAVDLLSFIAISRDRSKSLNGCLLVSMAGLKINVVQNTLSVFGNPGTVPVICVDNDTAGSSFAAQCSKLFACALVRQPDKKFKDWNDQLLFRN